MTSHPIRSGRARTGTIRALGTVLAAAVLLAGSGAASAAEKAVAVTQIVEHPALDACRQGIRDELAEAGWIEGDTLQWSYENAQGNSTTAVQIARKFIGDSPDVIVAISTPSAQSVAVATTEIPIVFSAVTDPVAAKLVADLDRPGGNITGVSDLVPIAKHLALIKGLVPEHRRIGVLYNPGEVNSVAIIHQLAEAAETMNIEIVEAVAPRSADVLAAGRSLVGRVDAIYVPTDNTVVSAFEAVVKVGIDAGIPVFAADTDSVERGAVAALGFNYYDVGRQTGAIVRDILDGADPATIPVRFIDKMQLHLNLASAERMGVEIPDEMIAGAAQVYR